MTYFVTFLVVGITPDCFVYFGWLHKVALANELPSHPLRMGYGNLCKDYYSFIIRTEDSQELVFIAVKRFGRRILVQSLINPKLLYTSMVTNDLLWMRINPLCRYKQFLTNELEFGKRSEKCLTEESILSIELYFTIDNFFSYKYRVFVYGHSTSNVIIKELKLSLDSGENFAPHVTSKSMIIDQMLAIPTAELRVRVVHDIRYTRESTKTGLLISETGESNEAKPINAVVIPFISVLTNNYRGASFYKKYDGFLYRPKSAEFTVYTSEKCRKTIGHFMLYEMRSEQEWTVGSLPNPEYLFNKIFTREWFNPSRFHRRMAYPHTIHRVVRRNIIYGWKYVAPVVFGLLYRGPHPTVEALLLL